MNCPNCGQTGLTKGQICPACGNRAPGGWGCLEVGLVLVSLMFFAFGACSLAVLGGNVSRDFPFIVVMGLLPIALGAGLVYVVYRRRK